MCLGTQLLRYLKSDAEYFVMVYLMLQHYSEIVILIECVL